MPCLSTRDRMNRFVDERHSSLAVRASASQPARSPPLDVGTDATPRDASPPSTTNPPSLSHTNDFTPDSRQEPYEVILHVRICAGGRPQGRSLPRYAETLKAQC